MISKSKEGSNRAIFEWHEYCIALLNIEGVTEDTVDDTRISYESCKNNAALLAADLLGDKKPTVLLGYWSDYHKA